MTTPINPALFSKHGLPEPVLEYQFHAERKWRFDAAWPEQKLAMEIEGGIWSGGRHNTPKGKHNDMEKMNEAAIAGWRILYISPRSVGTPLMLSLVKRAL